MSNYSGLFFIIGSNLIWAKLLEFPYIIQQNDISINYSEKGDYYLKIRGYFGKNESIVNHYKLLWKAYDIDNNFLHFDTTLLSPYPVFHFKRISLNHYEFSIIALDTNENILYSTKIQKLNPSQFLKKTILTRKNNTQTRLTPFSTSSGIEMLYEIDHQSFPYINLLSQITLNGIPFDGASENYPILEKKNFEVFEDGRLQPIRELLPPEPLGYSKIADIIIIHDDSGSLDDEAAQVKENINSFVSNLSDSGIDYRIGLLPYGGDGLFSYPNGTILHNGILSSEIETILNDVNQMEFDGGTENAFCALKKQLKILSGDLQHKKWLSW
ncbi:MAG: hypothetical protein OMM_01601 [Candidatus Magnetoglobus multicellularis str. Araruama]|uniref:VWFA domain-containing protein n=1 Tax=Candidatus Magnetoglobus multicellularis str. Araruama TaxID=890399 RepID=A0A1V1PCT9_9BACT|nr:MAG: hypothetical protein OMM_01601 [Candidatus Magnetoglobus multicellularis str. Araruama]